MKKIGTIVLIFLSCVCFFACSKGAPKCSDDEAKKQVMEIFMSKMKDGLVDMAIKEELGMKPADFKNPKYKELKKWQASGKWYDTPLNERGKNDIKKIIDYVDTQWIKANPELTAIRTSHKDDENKKCLCRATPVVNGKEIPISYTVQYTDDGKIYVDDVSLR